MEITPALARQWSRIGSRGVYGQAILELATTDDKLVALSADLGNSSGLDRFRNAYPNRFVNVGIAEQNLVGFASGIAREGFTAFASSFAPFITMRAAEQVRMNLGYMQLNVKIVGIGSGLSMGFLGNSHFGLEDVAIIRSIPGITILSPADCAEIYQSVFAAANHNGPVYIRLTGGPNNPIVYESPYEFEIGKAIKLREGSDIAIFATGTMVRKSLDAAIALEQMGHSTSVTNVHTIKPIDSKAVIDALSSNKLVVSVEEHSVVGGLGASIAELKADLVKSCPVQIIGLPDSFGPTGEYDFLLEKYNLTGEGIASSIARRLELMNH